MISLKDYLDNRSASPTLRGGMNGRYFSRARTKATYEEWFAMEQELLYGEMDETPDLSTISPRSVKNPVNFWGEPTPTLIAAPFPDTKILIYKDEPTLTGCIDDPKAIQAIQESLESRKSLEDDLYPNR